MKIIKLIFKHIVVIQNIDRKSTNAVQKRSEESTKQYLRFFLRQNDNFENKLSVMSVKFVILKESK
ncbi:hypothetical protein [Chryseobacterium sp. EO14]|uniref:hypothetical protein n=1 Tax=Chryseobacterium sp. EO14 TaxID=2950551 RepID=UPI00210E780B|nr:hypothetical protein [Chryseobacterium sp. EO14]MCQ4140186.1 hypothetical protein [Chryseobacterium sp. EO14]